MTKSLTLILACFTALLLQNGRSRQIKKFYGGHPRYWNHTLKLYDNAGYSYSSWAHTGRRVRDTGNYELTIDSIRLNSLETKVTERHFGNKERQEQIEKKYKNFKKFKNEAFKVDKSVILMTGPKKLKNSTDSMEYFMSNLFEVKLEQK